MDQVLVEHVGIGAEPRLMDRARFEKLMVDKGWTLVVESDVVLPAGVAEIIEIPDDEDTLDDEF